MSHGITESDSMMSVRQMPWHGLGAVLPEYPTSIDDALDKSGLGWEVKQGNIEVVAAPEWTDNFGITHPATMIPAEGYIANVRSDNNAVLGVVSENYKIVQNKEAFQFLDSLINSDLYFETAGSLHGGKRVWVLAKMPDYVEVGGDQIANYIYVATSHDGSLSVTAAVSPIRIVCANTLGMALRGSDASQTYRFRHTGDMEVKYEEARTVLDLTINYSEQFKEVGDRLARIPMTQQAFETRVLNELFAVEDDASKRAVTMVGNAKESILSIWNGMGEDGDTRGNAPGTAWTAYNAVAEYADFGRGYTKRTNQVVRSFEDTRMKQKAFDLVLAATDGGTPTAGYGYAGGGYSEFTGYSDAS